MTTYDKHTQYAIEDRDDGYTVSVYYSRYQFISESAVVAIACRQALMAIAHDVAEQRRRRIEQLNEQRIFISMGRNGITGITSCSATVPVRYRD